MPVKILGQTANCLPERGNIFPGNGKAGGKLMAPIVLQQIRQLGQRSEEIKASIGAGAGFSLIAVETNEKGGTAKLLRHAGSHNADDALVPFGAGQDDGLRRTLSIQHGLRLAVNLQLHILPLLVQATQAAGNLLSPLGILREK